jgi:hypothetical protein
VNAFWFEAQVVIHKAVRGDLLVASHVYLGLVRACIEMAMALRDRAAGTHHHRTGAPTDATVLARIGAPPGAFTAIELVEAVAKVVAAFDDLASEWDTAYRRRRHLLKPMFASARAFVSAASATQAG